MLVRVLQIVECVHRVLLTMVLIDLHLEQVKQGVRMLHTLLDCHLRLDLALGLI